MLLRNGFTWDQTGLYVYMAFEFKESDSSSLEHRWLCPDRFCSTLVFWMDELPLVILNLNSVTKENS